MSALTHEMIGEFDKDGNPIFKYYAVAICKDTPSHVYGPFKSEKDSIMFIEKNIKHHKEWVQIWYQIGC